MFCSKCGKADQTADSYCRNCGEWLADNSSSGLLFGGSPVKQKLTDSITNVLIGLGIGLLIGFQIGALQVLDSAAVIYALCAFLFILGTWQFVRHIAILQKKSKHNDRRHLTLPKEADAKRFDSTMLETRDLLPEADTAQFIRDSVIENTTERLGEKVKR